MVREARFSRSDVLQALSPERDPFGDDEADEALLRGFGYPDRPANKRRRKKRRRQSPRVRRDQHPDRESPPE